MGIELTKEKFDRLLLEAIDEGLSSIGESSKQAIYNHLKIGFNIERQEIPKKLPLFKDALEKILGVGASFLEIIIMKHLHEKVGQTVQLQAPENFTFTEYIDAIKCSFLGKKELRTRMGEWMRWS